MATVRELITKLGFEVDESGIKRFDKRFGEIKNSISGTSRNLQGFGRSVQSAGLKMTAFLTLPIAGLGLASLKTASDVEQLDIAFETMLGGAEKSKKFMEELFAFVAKTPFQLKDASTNAKILLGMGIEAKKLIPTLKAMGDVASGLSVPLERIALNFGQVKTQGKLTGAELRDFARAGVPIIGELAKILGVSKKEVKKLVSSGKVGFKDVEKAFINMTSEGGKFFNLMEKQSKSLGGRFSNLTDSFTLLLVEFGKMIEETFNLKENIRKLTDFITKMRTVFQSLDPRVKKAIVIFGAFVALIGPIVFAIGTLITSIAFLGASIVAVKALFIAFAPVVIALMLPLLKIIAIIVAVGVAIFLLIGDFKAWANGGNSVIGELLGGFQRFKDVIVNIFSIIKSVFVNLWKSMFADSSEASDKFFDKFVQGLKNLAILMLPILAKMVVKIITFLFGLGVVIGRLFRTILDGIGNLITTILGKIFTGIANFIRQSMKSIFDRIPKFIGKFGKLLDFGANITNKTESGASFGGLRNNAIVQSGRQSVSTVNSNAKVSVNLQIPMGTPEAQSQFLRDEAGMVFEQKMNSILSGSINSRQEVEK